ncbi:MAG: YkgJ family cysteine cluster protein [Candidatus Omnitrophota bacterium]
MKKFETDLNKITQLARDKAAENRKFRVFLQASQYPQKIDKIAHRLYKQIAPEIDCTACGNCCKLMDPVLRKKDIEKLSKVWVGQAEKSIKNYLIKDKKENGFMFKISPCPLLKKNKCSQYLSRPAGCKAYPNLEKKDFSLRLKKVLENYSICPIVFNVYEGLKAELQHGYLK